jgi:hypothetical protein
VLHEHLLFYKYFQNPERVEKFPKFRHEKILQKIRVSKKNPKIGMIMEK